MRSRKKRTMGSARGRNLVLLLCAALLLISPAVTSGVPDGVQELRKFLTARPFGQDDTAKVRHVVEAWPVEGAAEEHGPVKAWHEGAEIRDLKAPEEEEEEKKKPEGVVASVWSYLSGLTSPLRHVFCKYVHRLEKTKLVRNMEEMRGHRPGNWHGRHRGVVHSFFRRVRDSIWKHPERNAAVISATEPLVLEDGTSSAAQFAAKMIGIVGKVMDEYYASNVAPEEATTCVGILEEQVKKLVKSLKSALQEQLCDDAASSSPKQNLNFCNLFNIHPKMATLTVFAKADINPVTVALMKTSTAGFCASAEDKGDLLNSVYQVEFLAPHLLLKLKQRLNSVKYTDHEEHHMAWMLHKHDREDKENDQKDHHMFGMFHGRKAGLEGHHEQELEDEHDHEKHSMFHIFCRHKPDHEHRHLFGMFRRHELDHEEHDLPRLCHKHKNEHDLKEHHWFGMFRRHEHDHDHEEHMKHHEFEHSDEENHKLWWHQGNKEMTSRDALGPDAHVDENSCKDCFHRGVQHLARGMKAHLAGICQSATSPKLIAACKFAKEHKCLTKTYLAVKIPIWEMVAVHCAHTCSSSQNFMLPVVQKLHRYAPNLGVNNIGRELVGEHGEDVAHRFGSKVGQHLQLGSEVSQLLESEPHLPKLGHLILGRCARHHANQVFRKALHLRGHVVGISNNNDKGEDGFPGLVRTHLIVLRGHPLHPEDLEDALKNAQALGPGHFQDMFSDLQDQVTKLVGAALSSKSGALPDLKTDVLFKPVHQHPERLGWTHVRNFRISAKPQFLLAEEDGEKPGLLAPLKEHVRNFRISARPRALPLVEVDEMPKTVVDDNESPGITDSEIELQDKTVKDSTEGGRAEM